MPGVHWCSQCDTGIGDLLYKVANREFKPPESCCHLNCRYRHQRLLSKVSCISESGHMFFARSKISHILAGLDPPCRKPIG